MDGAHRSVIALHHRVEHRDYLIAEDLAHDHSRGVHPQRVAHQVGQPGRTFALDVRKPLLEFDQMSISQQAALKSRLAERRARAGLDELETYQTWLRILPAEYVARSLERKQRFRDLSPAERGASVAAWDRHRLRYGLTAQRLATPVDERPPTPDVEQAALLPDGAATRDAAFLERQGNLLDASEPQEAVG